MKRLPLLQVLGILLVSLLTLAAAAPVRGTTGSGSAASLLPGFQDHQPVPATTCTASTRCYSDFSLISCSGSFCSKLVGCSVVCDGVETECPGGDEPYCP